MTCKYCKNFYYPSNIKSHEIDCYKEVLLREEEEEKVREKLKRAEKVRSIHYLFKLQTRSDHGKKESNESAKGI